MELEKTALRTELSEFRSMDRENAVLQSDKQRMLASASPSWRLRLSAERFHQTLPVRPKEGLRVEIHLYVFAGENGAPATRTGLSRGGEGGEESFRGLTPKP